MIALFRVRLAKQVLLSAVAMTALVTVLSGCDQSGYDPELRYPPRTDPLFKEDTAVSGDELVYPDRPGQLPILSLANAEDPNNPLNRVLKANNLLDPLTKLNADQRNGVQVSLEKLFGTPAKPTVQGAVDEGEDITGQLQSELKLGNDVLASGSRLYRLHCLHCHGLTGDGRGPTAFWVNPHPRDYRQGVFKFTSVNLQGAMQKPRRDDLLRTMRQGIDGTSMPSFGLLHQQELEDLASYVIHLSLRGQTEYIMMKDIINGEKREAGSVLNALGKFWMLSQSASNTIKPDPFPYMKKDINTGEMVEDKEEVKQAVQRGRNFFMDEKAGCVSCHTNWGRGAKFRFDVWGTLVKPADLTVSIYRGGRRPIDLYNRVEVGINGAGMAAFGPTLREEAAKFAKSNGKEGKVKSPWDVVKFVEILPYPQMRAEYGIQID